MFDLQSKSMDWFLYDRDLRQERVKPFRVNILIHGFPVFCSIEVIGAIGKK